MTGENENIWSTILRFSLRTLINIILLFVLVEAFVVAYQYSYKLFSDLPYLAASQDVTTIVIEQGQTTKDIALILEQSGIVENQYLFLARAYLGKYNNKIQAGTYTLGPGMTLEEICRKLCGIQSEDNT